MSDGSRHRRLLPSEVAAQIQAKILDGSFAPGDRLPPERELASRLNVNRSSVREALKKLEELRLVDIQQGSGTRVRAKEQASFELVWNMVFPAGPENVLWIQELLELREVLLPGVLRIGLARATDSELEAAVAEIRRVADPALGAEDFIDGLRELQGVIARLTHNRVMILLANSMMRFLAQRPLVRGMLELVQDRRALLPLLQRFAIAVAARDLDTAQRAAREILRRVTRLVLSAAEGSGPVPTEPRDS
ncbi:MAG TPA: GntR family transcriptional regulator [Myxococcota bacterium]|nr:GntR family transcriptional regulator [Myxococcota bacterium]